RLGGSLVQTGHHGGAHALAGRLHGDRGEAASSRLCDPATGAGRVHGAEVPANLLLHLPRRLRDTFIDAPAESVDALAGGLLDLAADLAAGGAGELLLPPLLSFVAPLVPQLPHEGEVSDLGPVLHSAREVAGHEVGQTLGEVGELLHPHPQAVAQDDEEGLAHPVEEFTPPLREVVNRLSQRPEGLPQPLAVLPGPEQSHDNDAEEARTPEEPAARQGANEARHASTLHAGQAAKPPEHREQRLEQAQRTSQQAEPASGNEDVRGVGGDLHGEVQDRGEDFLDVVTVVAEQFKERIAQGDDQFLDDRGVLLQDVSDEFQHLAPDGEELIGHRADQTQQGADTLNDPRDVRGQLLEAVSEAVEQATESLTESLGGQALEDGPPHLTDGGTHLLHRVDQV